MEEVKIEKEQYEGIKDRLLYIMRTVECMSAERSHFWGNVWQFIITMALIYIIIKIQ